MFEGSKLINQFKCILVINNNNNSKFLYYLVFQFQVYFFDGILLESLQKIVDFNVIILLK